MGKIAFATIRLSFVLVVISAILSLAMYSSVFSSKNSISRALFDINLEFAEEEEERTVREVPETEFCLDHFATALLNSINKKSSFPSHINLSPQDYCDNFKKPPRLS